MDGSQRDYRGASKGFVLFAAAYLLFTGVATMLTQVGLPDSAAAILFASAILMAFMPKYRYGVGHSAQPVGTPAPQEA